MRSSGVGGDGRRRGSVEDLVEGVAPLLHAHEPQVEVDGRVADGAGPRRAAGVGDTPYGTQAPVQQGLTAERPFDQTRPGGDA